MRICLDAFAIHAEYYTAMSYQAILRSVPHNTAHFFKYNRVTYFLCRISAASDARHVLSLRFSIR